MTRYDVINAPGAGHNLPPKTPFEAAGERIETLHVEANNWLDGDAIANQGQADTVAELLDDARKARKEADAARKVENKPFDVGKALEKHASRAAKDKGTAKGGQRAVTLRTKYTPTITDLTACARHYWATDRAALEALLADMVQRDVRAGKRNIPGVEITEERVAV